MYGVSKCDEKDFHVGYVMYHASFTYFHEVLSNCQKCMTSKLNVPF